MGAMFSNRAAPRKGFGGQMALALLSFAIFVFAGTAWLIGTVHPCSISFGNGWDVSLDSGECILGFPSSDLPAMLPICLRPVTAFAAVLPLIWIMRHGLGRKSNAQGLCRVCGYDLRATPTRCPECGTQVAQLGEQFGSVEDLMVTLNRRRPK